MGFGGRVRSGQPLGLGTVSWWLVQPFGLLHLFSRLRFTHLHQIFIEISVCRLFPRGAYIPARGQVRQQTHMHKKPGDPLIKYVLQVKQKTWRDTPQAVLLGPHFPPWLGCPWPSALPVPCTWEVCLCGALGLWGRSCSHGRDGAEAESAEGADFHMWEASVPEAWLPGTSPGCRCICPDRAPDPKALSMGTPPASEDMGEAQHSWAGRAGTSKANRGDEQPAGDTLHPLVGHLQRPPWPALTCPSFHL